MFDRDPEQAREALRLIHRTNQQSLADLRRALEVLRAPADHDAPPRAPAPGLARLDELITAARAGGVRVAVLVEGSPVAVPAMVDQAAFRIVQESLTNVVRHAGGAPATVRVCYRAEELIVEISDDGPGPATDGRRLDSGTGTGLAGMRERAEAVGGHLVFGPGPRGGFQVRARLPLPAT